jgi:hypothetical protein
MQIYSWELLSRFSWSSLALDSHPRFSLYKGHILESSLTSHRVLGRKQLQAHDEEL